MEEGGGHNAEMNVVKPSLHLGCKCCQWTHCMLYVL